MNDILKDKKGNSATQQLQSTAETNATASRLPEIVRKGGACRFCEREFIDKLGKPVFIIRWRFAAIVMVKSVGKLI